MKEIEKIKAIVTNNKEGVLRAAELLKKIEINVFSSEESRKKFTDSEDFSDEQSKYAFLVYSQKDKCWNIQSHFTKDQMSLNELDAFVEKRHKEKELNSILYTLVELRLQIRVAEDELETFVQKGYKQKEFNDVLSASSELRLQIRVAEEKIKKILSELKKD